MSNITLPVADLYSPVVRGLDRVVEIMDSETGSDFPFVNELCEVARGRRGKMLRPGLLLLTAHSLGGVTEVHCQLAAVVELIHIASLTHDDVLDGSQVRRDQPTINSLVGNQAAVMLGDYLVSHAYRISSSLGLDYASQLLSRVTNKVCEGELLQLHRRDDYGLSEAEYYEIIERKTAELTAACCNLGAKYACADDEVVRAMHEFGISVGMAFQIVDDILDLTGCEERMGKTLGRDLQLGEFTLPFIHCLSGTDRMKSAELLKLLNDATGRDRQRIADLLRASGSIDYAVSAAGGYVSAALRNLDSLPDSEGRRSLVTMTRFILDRDF